MMIQFFANENGGVVHQSDILESVGYAPPSDVS